MAGAPVPAPQGGAASEVFGQIVDGMMQASDLMNGSDAVSPEEKQEWGALASAVQNFIEEKLGSAPGPKPMPAPGPGGSVSPEAGGNPNAKPMMG